MATIDLGKIKLVWRGTYAGGTAYTVDDVVQHTDGGVTSSFICTTNSTGNAPSTGGSVHGSWAYLAKGHADTVSTTLTTQGDILYRDGSGLQRLAKGTAGQALKINSGATAPEWGTDVGGKILQFVNGTDATQYELTFTSPTTDTAATTAMSITPTAANSKVCVNFFFGQIMSKDGSGVRIRIYRQINNGGYSILTSTQGTASGSNRPAAFAGNFGSHTDSEDVNRTRTLGGLFIDSPNTTNQVDYKVYVGQGDSGTRYVYVNRTRGNGDENYSNQTKFHWYAMEVGA